MARGMHLEKAHYVIMSFELQALSASIISLASCKRSDMMED